MTQRIDVEFTADDGVTLGGVNVKIVAALSPQLFARQPASYRDSVAGPSERLDAMVITNGAFKLMRE